MRVAPKPANELQRIAALYEYDLLDTLPEQDYDDITQIAADICGVPISLISLIDNDRQWFKSRVGLGATETHRDLAFCAHAIREPEDIFIVSDPANDERFYDNPLVTGDPNIAFYAGIPLVNNTGNALGTLCVIDNKPRILTKAQKETLKALARQTVAHFEIRRKNIELNEQKAQMEVLNEDLSRFAYVVAHDIKSPCSSLAMSASYLKTAYGHLMDGDGMKLLNMMEETSLSAINMVEGILNHTQVVNNAEIEKEHFTLNELVQELKNVIIIPTEFSFKILNGDTQLYSSRYMLFQVLLNLCNNAIKYNDKKHGEIELLVTDEGARYSFSVKDNGRGISDADQSRIFDLFSTLGVTDRFNNKGSGIGLSTVKRLVQKMSGEITISSTPGEGSCFEFTVGK